MNTSRHARWGRAAAAVGVAALVAAPLAGASAGTPSSDLAPLLATDAPDAIAGDYIVVLNKSAALDTVSRVEATAVAAGATVNYRYSTALRGFAATLTPAALDAVRKDPAVDYVEADALIPMPADNAVSGPSRAQQDDPTWGLDRIDQRDLPLDQQYDRQGDGQGVTVYVIDTGIWMTHEEFQGRARSGYDFEDKDRDATDCNGHGTHVSGTIGGKTYGVANKVDLVGVRVFPCTGGASASRIIKAVEWVIDDAKRGKPNVVNMSLGGHPRRALDGAITVGIHHDISFVVSAGNAAADACDVSPARTPGAITVGATDINDNEASFSNWGECLDIYAPGVNITSAWIGSDTATSTISGTSMSAPHVSGVAALVLGDDPDLGPKHVRQAIRHNATDNRLNGLGEGSPDKLLYSLIR